jgi:Ca2+-binding RTX toxin-like protein/subtilisin-like proprotein convertase family protein
MSQGSVITGTVNTGETLTGTIGEDTIKGLVGNDSLLGGAGNDTLIGGAGNDTGDGGSGYNTYVVTGGADAFYWTVNASGDVLLTDSVTDPADPIDGSNEGVDTLRNIQAIQYVHPDGTVESTFVVDDFGNSPDAGNYQIQYGVWVNGRANFYGDLDYFKLQTTAGQKVVVSMGSGSTWGYLPESGKDGSYSNIDPYGSKTWAYTTTGLQDIYFLSMGLSSSSPMTSKGYSFILRRELDGTDGNDALTAGSDYEHLLGGVGNDTITGSDRSDYLEGGADNDLLTGGKGNDELDGGAGTANVAVFTGNKADYSVTWLGSNLSLRISDNVAGWDGTDSLVNVQVLRFADGDVTLDRESNTPVQTAVALGTAMTGSLPVTRNDGTSSVDIDYFQQKFTADISTNTALRISLQASGGSSYYGYIGFQFYQTGSIDALTFNNLGSTGTISQFGDYLSPGSQQSWIVSPKQWGSGSEFQSMAQRADLKVWGWFTNGTSAQLGDLAGYTIKVDRVLFGTTGADTIIGDGLSGYIDARDGTDVVTGSSIDEQIIGGLGDDTLSGGGGNDILIDSAGRNSLSGGDGDDLIDLSAGASPTSTVDGGAGIDTLKIASDTNWAGLSVTGVEVLDGNGGRTALTPQQVATLGFTTSQNITFRLDPYLASGGSLDASGLAGNLNLRGTNQSDMLTGNAGNNTIWLTSDEAVGAGNGVDTVNAGAGDDTIVWSTRQYQQSSQFFSSADAGTKTYKIKGEVDGGAGTDILALSFNENYIYHAWGGNTWEQANTPAWKVDLTELNISGIEQLSVSGYDLNRFWAYPFEFILTAAQIASLSSTSGLRALSIVGGGLVDLAHLSAIGITTWRTGDALAYQISGTVSGDTLTVGAGAINADLGEGNDEFVIENKALVTDTLSGGEGIDMLTIRGSDVDLSGAVLSGIESIKVSAQSLSMTESQWSALGSLVQRVSGASTGYILSITEPGITTLAADSPYVGLTGSTGDDRLIGNTGNNILVGGVGNDELSGNAGNDRLVTGAGIDTLFGGDGDDTLVITDKTVVRDQLDGGAGVDTLQVSDGQNMTAATLSGLEVLSGSGTVTLTPEQLAGFQSVRGAMVQLSGDASTLSMGSTQFTNGAGVLLPLVDSTLTATSGILGSKGDDIIGGSVGADLIFGGRGSDHLDGGAGADTLIGGSGVDTLLGGAGDDLFRVEASELTGGTVYSDIMDGGSGNDTLELNVGGDSSSYQINAGAISNIQRLVVNNPNNYWTPTVLLTAELWSTLTSFISSNYVLPYRVQGLTINGTGNSISFTNVDAASKIGRLNLTGTFSDIDASNITLGATASISLDTAYNYHRISVSAFNSIQLSGGNDYLIVSSDESFTVNAGAGDDCIRLSNVRNLAATLNGGDGIDTLELSGNGFVDLTKTTLTNIESIKYGTATLVVTDTQLGSWSFDGSGAKFTKIGDAIVGTAGNDSYSGNGAGSFQGGRGDDSISYVNTAVFSGNMAEYNFTRSGTSYIVEHALGTPVDGKDTLVGVMNLRFADTTIQIDDAPDNLGIGYQYSSLTVADYDKRISAKKDFTQDTDVFASTLAPNSPLAVEASSSGGSSWNIKFRNFVTGQGLQFKSLVHGSVNSSYYNWMLASDKWLPGFNTADGFKAYQGGAVALQYNLDGGIQDYAFTLKYLDDYVGSVDTTGAMDAQGGEVRGYIGAEGDADWVRTTLIAGTKYEFHLNGLASEGGTLQDPSLSLRDSAGRLIESGIDIQANAVGGDDIIIFRPVATGVYYLAVQDVGGINLGSWTLTQKSLDMIAGNISTTERLEWSAGQTFTVSSEVNVLGDHDWFRVWLDKGLTYDFRALGSSSAMGNTLGDPQLSVYSVTGNLLATDNNSGGGTDARLIYRASDSGWYFLDAGASGNMTKGTYTITGSSLADDYGNSVQTNGRVQVDVPVHGLISFNGDSDWFKVGLTAGQSYIIDLNGDISDGATLDPLVDPLLIIRDTAGVILFKADDFGGSLNARAYFTPTVSGAYYLEARSAFKYDVGAYQLSVVTAPPDDYVDTVSASTAHPGSVGQLSLGVAGTGVIGAPGDHDLFRLDMEAGKVYQIKAEGLSGHAGTLADPYLRVFDAAGHLVDYANNGATGSDAALYLAPTVTGSYFLELSSNQEKGLGTYQISANLRNLPPDDVPNDLSTHVSLSPGDSFTGQLLTHNDQDWFGITLVAQKDYVFRVQASDSGNGTLLDPVLEVHAGDGTLVKSSDNSLISHEPFMVFTPVAQGTYYLVVKAADGQTDTGSYTLLTRAPDDYSDSKPGATLITLDQTVDGAIQWAYGSYGVRAVDSVGVPSDADADWFKFTATAGEVLSVTVQATASSTLSRPMVEIVDANNLTLAIGDGLETTSGKALATFRITDAGIYYARVIDGAGATGEYQLRLAAGDASDEDATAPVVLDFTSQGALSIAQIVAKIGLSGDTDTFDLTLQGGHNYRIETLAVRDGSTAPLQSASLGLSWLASGQTAAESVAVSTIAGEPSFYESSAFSPLTSGHLSVTVQPTDSTQTGQYKLRVVDLGVTTEDVQPDQVSSYVDATHGVLASNSSVSGVIDMATDIDLFAITLTAGNIYDFSLKGFADGLGTLAQGKLQLLDSSGSLVTTGRFDAATGRAQMAVSVFADGRYYLAAGVANQPGNTGSYMLDSRMRDLNTSTVDDISADTRSGVTVMPGKPASGIINYAGDSDWISANLLAGKVYVVDQLGNGDGAGGTLKDGFLRILDASGNEVAVDDNSGAGSDARLIFTPQSSQTYYFEVSGTGAETGTYTLRLRELYGGIADPLKSAQWYLPALGLEQLNNQYSGAGMTIGLVDDGIDTSHPDLQSQIDFALSYDAAYKTQDGNHKQVIPPDFHGTMVAGIMVATANNETGIVGIAPDAEIASTRVKWTWEQITDALGKQYQFDISNNSWSAIDPFGDNFNSTTLTFAYEALRRGVEDGRGQNGTVFVFSAGNSASSGDNTNYHNFQNAREVIAVAAAESDGSLASFSTPGANVLVGAYGVGLLTTDRHQAGLGMNPAGNYANFTGTSAAAPVVSGIVALMLEANPNLGYRDVQKILALSATHPDTQSWKINGASNWNLGGMHYNDGMGFGLVDAYSAVQLAKTWTDSNTAINEVSDSARAFGLHDAIPDGDGTVYSRTFAIDSAMQVEHLELGIDLRHTRLGDLVIEVISPNGTVSRLMDRPTVNAEQPFGLSGVDSGVPTHLLWDFSSVQFMGGQAAGDWTVVVKDVRAEETGTIYSMSLRVYGERADGNDIYVFTEEGFKQQGSVVLQDESGTDTINASVMLHDTFIDLSAGLVAAEGVTYKIADWSVIEQAFTGAGNDRLVGNSTVNWLKGGASNDTLEGGASNDTLDGGAGSDTVVYAGAMAEYNISWNPDTKQVMVIDNKITGGDDGQDTLVGVERLVFSDGDLSLGTMVGNHAPVAKATLFDTPILFAKGMGIQYDLPDNAFTDADSGDSVNVQIEISSASGGELPEWLSYDPVTRQFSGVPPVDLQGQIKVLVTAIDEFGTTASDILTLQFGDNQAPLLDNPSEKIILEDAGLVALAITAPLDPEGKAVTVKVLDLPTFGTVLDKLGNIVSAGQEFSADAFSELHYQTASDANGNAGYLRYQATDADGVMAESSVHLFLDAVNDAPRFATAAGKLVINYPAQSTVTLDLDHPVDPESVLNTVRLTELPAMGTVSLDGHAVMLNQVLTFDQLDRLSFTLAENVNGPIGALSIQAVDPQGLANNWSLTLEVQGAAASNVGTAGTDALYGSIGNDTLYGMGGNDTLVGNAGNDRLLGGLGNDTLFGGSGNDALDGSSGNDYLDGGSGNDTMSGGPGNDTYLVDSLADVVLEVISGGTGGKDLILTSVSLTATDNVESLQAAAGYAINLTGNALGNTLVGNEMANLLTGDSGRDTLAGGAGNDTLHGGSGIDHLAGGAGEDLYHVDSRSDVVVELFNEGIDTVRASSSFTLSSNVENLILEEGGDYTAGGNSLSNHIWGNAGNNILAGGLGIDTLEGGLGNDIYVLSDSLDTIIDTGGTDTVRSSLDITLKAGMENAELVGIGDTVAIGNGTKNLLVGNMGDNILEGMGGVDTLTGGEGSDQIIISYNGAGTAPDRITDFTPGRDLLVIDLASLGISPEALGLLSSGTVASDSFVRGAGARALDLNDYFLLDTAQELLLFDLDGSGPAAPMELVQLVGVDYATMSGADIFVGV